jgi:hypothetical protein
MASRTKFLTVPVRIADRTHETQQSRASGLSHVIAAIVYRNSTYIADAVSHLSAIGELVPEELLAHTLPVGWGHIAFSGDSSGTEPPLSRPDAGRSAWTDEYGSFILTEVRSHSAQFR